MLINSSLTSNNNSFTENGHSNKTIHLSTLSLLGYIIENDDWYKEDIQELPGRSSHAKQGLIATSNALMFFVENLNFDIGYEHIVSEMEVFSLFIRSAKVHIKKENIEVEHIFKTKRPDKNNNPELILYDDAIQLIVAHSHNNQIFLQNIKKLLGEYIVNKAVEKLSLSPRQLHA